MVATAIAILVGRAVGHRLNTRRSPGRAGAPQALVWRELLEDDDRARFDRVRERLSAGPPALREAFDAGDLRAVGDRLKREHATLRATPEHELVWSAAQRANRSPDVESAFSRELRLLCRRLPVDQQRRVDEVVAHKATMSLFAEANAVLGIALETQRAARTHDLAEAHDELAAFPRPLRWLMRRLIRRHVERELHREQSPRRAAAIRAGLAARKAKSAPVPPRSANDWRATADLAHTTHVRWHAGTCRDAPRGTGTTAPRRSRPRSPRVQRRAGASSASAGTDPGGPEPPSRSPGGRR